MKICHVCFTECEDHWELCPLCGADLTTHDKEEEKDTEYEEVGVVNPTFLTKFEDIVSAEIFEDILKENEIPTISAENEQGSMQVLFGGSFFAKEIYVDENNLENAQNLLKEFLENEENYLGEFDFDTITDEEE